MNKERFSWGENFFLNIEKKLKNFFEYIIYLIHGICFLFSGSQVQLEYYSNIRKPHFLYLLFLGKRLPKKSLTHEYPLWVIKILSRNFTPSHWFLISKHQKLSEAFIRKHFDKFLFDILIQYQKLPKEMVIKFFSKENLYLMLQYQHVPEELIEQYADSIDRNEWGFVSSYQDISLEFIEKFKEELVWSYLPYKKFSEDFIRKHKDYVDWNRVRWNKENYSEEFKKEFALELAEKISYDILAYNFEIQPAFIGARLLSFDLVATPGLDHPKGTLFYLDYVYDNNKRNKILQLIINIKKHIKSEWEKYKENLYMKISLSSQDRFQPLGQDSQVKSVSEHMQQWAELGQVQIEHLNQES